MPAVSRRVKLPRPENPETPRPRQFSAALYTKEAVVRSISPPNLLRQAQFLLSVAQTDQLPPDFEAEVAFAGRSNAGKSSALNALTDHKGLAHVSKAPGRTRLINFFTINDLHALVDLPGYGYAAVAAEIKAGWDALLGGYLRDRRALRGVVVVMDCRHPLTEQDETLLEFCASAGRPVHVLLSKADKLTRSERIKTLRTVEARLSALAPQMTAQLFSVLSGEGVEAARTRVSDWLGLEKPPDKKMPRKQGERVRGS